jgi:REP element-mobilizing transposase RayT
MKPQFDPKRHHRRSIRLPGHDYRSPGAYFVTICTHQRDLLFDDPVLRRVVETQWQRILRHSRHVRLDAWVVMPNHVHGIIVIRDDHGRGEASPEAVSSPNRSTLSGTGWEHEPLARDASPLLQAGSLGAIVGNFKSVTARRINRIRQTPGLPVWQRNYYEHVLRNERAWNAIRQYIAENPARWAWDTYNPVALGPDSHAAELWRLLQQPA